jgi:PAS domain S-box-containing protein
MAEPEAMREEKEQHQYVVQQMADFYQPLMDVSSDGVAVYLDDEHKLCNQNLAEMCGYSVEQWSARFPFLDTFVAPESRDEAAATYEEVNSTGVSKTSEQTWLRKDGTTFRVRMAITPVLAGDDLFALMLVKRI